MVIATDHGVYESDFHFVTDQKMDVPWNSVPGLDSVGTFSNGAAGFDDGPTLDQQIRDDQNAEKPTLGKLKSLEKGMEEELQDGEPSPNGVKPQNVSYAMDKSQARIVVRGDSEDWSSFHNTELSPELEKKYNDVFNEPLASRDYDMRGYFSNASKEELDKLDTAEEKGLHFPDTYKKPNHITFSDESKFHGLVPGDLPIKGQKPYEGGHWDQLEDKSYTFTPGETNFKYHTPQEMIDYFKKYEKGNKLILPGS